MSKTAKELEEEELERKRRKYDSLLDFIASKGVRVLSLDDCSKNSCDLGKGSRLERDDKEQKLYLKPEKSMKNEGIVIVKNGRPVEVIDFGLDGEVIGHHLLEGQVSVFSKEMLKGVKTQSFDKNKTLEAFVKPEIAKAAREASELKAELRKKDIAKQLKGQHNNDIIAPPSTPKVKSGNRGYSR